MKLATVAVVTLALSIAPASAAPGPLPKDCPKAFVRAWAARAALSSLPTPKVPCVMHSETGIYICDSRGCARP